MSLVGVLEVRPGDLVELFDYGGDSIGGYVTNLRVERGEISRVQLSQNNPRNKICLVVGGLHGVNIFEGKKWYKLDKFEDYRVVPPQSSGERRASRPGLHISS